MTAVAELEEKASHCVDCELARSCPLMSTALLLKAEASFTPAWHAAVVSFARFSELKMLSSRQLFRRKLNSMLRYPALRPRKE